MPLVSLLVPIYNVECYLEQCLESARNQTHADLEIICINDGSTDGSRDIIQRYLDADERFRVIDKPNSGYGASMNRGLDAARGDYIAILESDDIFEPCAIEHLLEACQREDADVAKANYTFFWSQPMPRYEFFENVKPWLAGRTVDPRECKDVFFLVPSIWSAIYKRSLIVENGIRFLETPGASYQDTAFAFKIWACARRATFLAESVLFYRQDNEKSSVNSPGKVYCVCDEYAEMERFLSLDPQRREAFEAVLQRNKYNTYMWNYERLADDLKMDFLERMSNELACGYEAADLDLALFDPFVRADVQLLMNAPRKFHEYHERYWRDTRGLPLLRRYLHLGGAPLASCLVADRLADHLGLQRLRSLVWDAGLPQAPSPAGGNVGHIPQHDIQLPAASEGPYVSVVVPVYNTAHVLDECLASLALQTLRNIEVICVNDGSTDFSRDKLARWQAKDARIRVIDKQNGGVSSARNVGIRAARAGIVTFLDSDDRFKLDACEKILATMLATGADVLTVGADVFPATNVDPWVIGHLSPRDAVFEGFDPSLIVDTSATPYIRTALRREFLLEHDLLFDEALDVGEDELFLVQAYTLSKRTVLLSDKLYDYRQTDTSVTHTTDYASRGAYLKHLAVADRVFGHWNQVFDDDDAVSVALRWAIDYVLIGALALPDPDRNELIGRFGALLKQHWPLVVLRQARLSTMERKLIDMVLSGRHVGDLRVRALNDQIRLRNQGPLAQVAKTLRDALR